MVVGDLILIILTVFPHFLVFSGGNLHYGFRQSGCRRKLIGSQRINEDHLWYHYGQEIMGEFGKVDW